MRIVTNHERLMVREKVQIREFGVSALSNVESYVMCGLSALQPNTPDFFFSLSFLCTLTLKRLGYDIFRKLRIT